MPINQSNRTLFAVGFLLAAAFIAMNYAVAGQPLLSWWLPVVLFAIGAGLALSARRQALDSSEADTPKSGAEKIQDSLPTPTQPQIDTAPGSSSERAVPYPGAPKSSDIGDSPAEVVPGEPPAPPAQPEKAEPLDPEKQSVSELTAAPPPPEEQHLSEPAAVESVMKAEASSSEPDDLTKVYGIGPKMASVLQAAGIDTYAKLAATSNERIQEIINEAGMRLARSLETWNDQAKLLDAGDDAGLEELLKKLSE
jgi:predicted flap endonuclease-1-like 5' DNA nuclease